MGKRKYTPGQLEYIRKMYPTTDTHLLASELNTTYSAIKELAKRLKVVKANGKHCFTSEEDARIRAEYPNTLTEHLASEMGLSVCSVYNRAHAMGVHKTPEFLSSDLGGRLTAVRAAGLNTRFKKGQIPLNKGQKMSSELYAKCAKTMFKKGNMPHNTKFDGYERIDCLGYRYRRISNGVFYPVHYINWEAKNGPVPEKHILIFTDRNRLNCEPSNLQCISYEENMSRNTINRYPQELKEAIRLHHKLIRKINKQNGKEQAE